MRAVLAEGVGRGEGNLPLPTPMGRRPHLYLKAFGKLKVQKHLKSLKTPAEPKRTDWRAQLYVHLKYFCDFFLNLLFVAVLLSWSNAQMVALTLDKNLPPHPFCFLSVFSCL